MFQLKYFDFLRCKYTNRDKKLGRNQNKRHFRFGIVALICTIDLLQHLHVILAIEEGMDKQINSSSVPLRSSLNEEEYYGFLQFRETNATNYNGSVIVPASVPKKTSVNNDTSNSSFLNSFDKNYIQVLTNKQKFNSAIINITNASSQHKHQQQQPKSNKPINYSILSLVRSIDTRLRTIRNVELGITSTQEIFDGMEFTPNFSELNATLDKISKNLSKKLQKAYTDINNLKQFFEKNVTQKIEKLKLSSPFNNEVFLNTIIQPCPFTDVSLEQNYNKHQIKIMNYLNKNNLHHYNEDFSTDNYFALTNKNLSFELNGKISEEIRCFNYKYADINNYKHIYFLSKNDFASDNFCQYYFNNLMFRQLFVTTRLSKKHFFLLIDIGNAIRKEQMELSTALVSHIVEMLTNSDSITIVTLSHEAIPMQLTEIRQYPRHKLSYLATSDNKAKILNYIAALQRSTEPTNHSLGFEYSFDLLKQQNLSVVKPFEFLYITRGLLSQLSDASNVLSTIAIGQQALKFPIIINTCAVILDEKHIMYEKQFLNDIVSQNYTKYNIDVSQWDFHPNNLIGTLYFISKKHPERINKISTEIFSDLSYRYGSIRMKQKQSQNYEPIVSYNAKDDLVSLVYNIRKLGVIGIDLHFSDLAEDVLNFINTSKRYIFLINVNGIAIVHPALQKVPNQSKTLHPVDIALLENSKHFLNFRKILLTQKGGSLTLEEGEITNSKTSIVKNKTYLWQRIKNVFIICIVKITPNNNDKTSFTQATYNNYGDWQKFLHLEPRTLLDLSYHRIDLVSPHPPLCRYFRQIATLDSITLFLSASSFQSPFTHIKDDRANGNASKVRTVQSIMAYIKDSTGLLANPGLLPRIKTDVNALYSVMVQLKKRHLENGEFKRYIIRRYAATISGVMQVYPGCLLETDFDVIRRPWFLKAMQNPGKIVLTEPYLDAGGAGYIITIAHTIFEGKINALHSSERDLVVAVIALDVPYAFFYKLILDIPFCQKENIKCILFENGGYLIAHPSMVEPISSAKNARRPYEHLTHKESFLANDILNHKNLVTKLACTNYQNRTVQRYYKFNTSFTEILTNVVYSERTKYKITSVWSTNIFAAIINSTNGDGAFCPCSTLDRTCLNCNRMDKTDCECPCECPMRMKTYDDDDDDDEDGDVMNGDDSVDVDNNDDEEDNDNDNNADDVDDAFNDDADNDNEGYSTEEYELFHSYTNQYAYCEPPLNSHPYLDGSNLPNNDWNIGLNTCLHINCDIYLTQFDCFAVMGCEWCQLDMNGNPLSVSFCTRQTSCFNGVLNSLTPYGDVELSSIMIELQKSQPYSAFGPAGGAIIVLCVIIGFSMYCYRQSLENNSEQFFMESMHDDNYGMVLSRFNFDNNSPPDNNCPDDLDDINGGALSRNYVYPIGNAIAVPDISPYHMSTGSSYRRPPNGESDHGYSTMTPHEDSEHTCFTLSEPLIKNKVLSNSDSLSINISVLCSPNNKKEIIINRRPNDNRFNSSQTPPCMIEQTDLGNCNEELVHNEQQQQTNPHHILAPVAVHRHMEAS